MSEAIYAELKDKPASVRRTGRAWQNKAHKALSRSMPMAFRGHLSCEQTVQFVRPPHPDRP